MTTLVRPAVINLKGKLHDPAIIAGLESGEIEYLGRRFTMGGWDLPGHALANPYRVGRDGTREECCEKYRRWVPTQPHLMALLPGLRGKTLACWCHPLACHADVVADLVAAMEGLQVDWADQAWLSGQIFGGTPVLEPDDDIVYTLTTYIGDQVFVTEETGAELNARAEKRAARDFAPRSIPCPRCPADRGQECRTPTGYRAATHAGRRKAVAHLTEEEQIAVYRELRAELAQTIAERKSEQP